MVGKINSSYFTPVTMMIEFFSQPTVQRLLSCNVQEKQRPEYVVFFQLIQCFRKKRMTSATYELTLCGWLIENNRVHLFQHTRRTCVMSKAPLASRL